MGVAELRRLRQLEEENQRLKRLVADLSLDKEMLQEVIKTKKKSFWLVLQVTIHLLQKMASALPWSFIIASSRSSSFSDRWDLLILALSFYNMSAHNKDYVK